MSIKPSGDNQYDFKMARAMIEMAAQEEGSQKDTHLQAADRLLTGIWSEIRPGDSNAFKHIGLSLEDLKSKLSIVGEALVPIKEQRDLNINSPSINVTGREEVFSPSQKNPAQREAIQKAKSFMAQQRKEYFVLLDKYVNQFDAFQRGETISVNVLEYLKKRTEAHVKKYETFGVGEKNAESNSKSGFDALQIATGEGEMWQNFILGMHEGGLL